MEAFCRWMDPEIRKAYRWPTEGQGQIHNYLVSESNQPAPRSVQIASHRLFGLRTSLLYQFRIFAHQVSRDCFYYL